MPGKLPKVVKCVECGQEFDINQMDECPKCELDMGEVIRRHRINKGVAKMQAAEAEQETQPKRKKGGDW